MTYTPLPLPKHPTEMSKQEIFDHLCAHIYHQNLPAYSIPFTLDFRSLTESIANSLPGCAYRAPDGRRCAVGAFIPDEAYSPDMEGASICVMDFAPEKFASIGWIREHLQFFINAQQVHDWPYHWETTETMRRELVKLAALFNLDPAAAINGKFADR